MCFLLELTFHVFFNWTSLKTYKIVTESKTTRVVKTESCIINFFKIENKWMFGVYRQKSIYCILIINKMSNGDFLIFRQKNQKSQNYFPSQSIQEEWKLKLISLTGSAVSPVMKTMKMKTIGHNITDVN